MNWPRNTSFLAWKGTFFAIAPWIDNFMAIAPNKVKQASPPYIRNPRSFKQPPTRSKEATSYNLPVSIGTQTCLVQTSENGHYTSPRKIFQLSCSDSESERSKLPFTELQL